MSETKKLTKPESSLSFGCTQQNREDDLVLANRMLHIKEVSKLNLNIL